MDYPFQTVSVEPSMERWVRNQLTMAEPASTSAYSSYVEATPGWEQMTPAMERAAPPSAHPEIQLNQQNCGARIGTEPLRVARAVRCDPTGAPKHPLENRGDRKERTCGLLSMGDLRRVFDYLDSRLHEPIALASMAAVLELSQFHFARLFKATVGCSPIQYVIEIRLLRAFDLVRTTATPLLELALDLGFSDSSHMTRLFRRHFGVTPSSVRKAAEQKQPGFRKVHC